MASLALANNADGSITLTIDITAADLPDEPALVAKLRGAVQPLLDAANDLGNQANVITTAAEQLNRATTVNATADNTAPAQPAVAGQQG